MAAERQVDWELVKSQYMAGMRSVRSIAREHGFSHTYLNKIAKELNWDRPLGQRIKDTVSTRLVSNSNMVSTDPKVSTGIVESTANEIVEVLGTHRFSAKKQQEIIRKLATELDQRMSATTLTLDDIKACALIMNNITQSFSRLVGIERVNCGLDEDPDVAKFFAGKEQLTQKRIIVNFVDANIVNNYGENSRPAGGFTPEAAISVQ